MDSGCVLRKENPVASLSPAGAEIVFGRVCIWSWVGQHLDYPLPESKPQPPKCFWILSVWHRHDHLGCPPPSLVPLPPKPFKTESVWPVIMAVWVNPPPLTSTIQKFLDFVILSQASRLLKLGCPGYPFSLDLPPKIVWTLYFGGASRI